MAARIPDFLLPEDEETVQKARAEAQALKLVQKGSRVAFLQSLRQKGSQFALNQRGPDAVDWDEFVNDTTTIVANSGSHFPLEWLARQSINDLHLLNSVFGLNTRALIDAKEAAIDMHHQRAERTRLIDQITERWTAFEMEAIRHEQEALRGFVSAGQEEALRQQEAFGSLVLDGEAPERSEDDPLERLSDGGPTQLELTQQEALEGMGQEEGPSAEELLKKEQLDTLAFALRSLPEQDLINQTPEQRQERIREWVERNFDQIQENTDYWSYFFAPDGPAPYIAEFGQFIGTGMKGFVDLVDGVASAAAGIQDLLGEGEWNGAHMQARIDAAAARQQEAFLQMQEEGLLSKGWGESLAEARFDLVNAAKAEQIAPEVLWEAYKAENPEEAQEFLFGFAAGDEVFAAQGFFQLIKDQEEVQIAIDELDKALSEQEWDLIKELREPDTAENVRAKIAAYGDWVEDNGTYLVALFGEAAELIANDAERFSIGKAAELALEARRTHESAAEYLGLQGTLTGLALDASLYTLDPINIVTSHRLGLAAAKTWTASKVRRFVNSARGFAELQDMVSVVRSGLRGNLSTVAMLDELDAVGLADEFFAAATGRTPVLPKGDWTKGPIGHAAHEVQLGKLVDDLNLTLPKADPKLVQELTEKGVSRPVTVNINGAEGVAWIDEADLPLLSAIRETGETSVPIVLKGSYDFAFTKRLKQVEDRIKSVQGDIDLANVALDVRGSAITKADEMNLRDILHELEMTPEEIEAAVIRQEIDGFEDMMRLANDLPRLHDELEFLLLEKEELLSRLPGRPLDEMGWKNPERYNNDGFASVRNNLPDELVYGDDVDWEALKDIQLRAHLLGAGSSNPRSMMISMALPTDIKETFKAVQAGKSPWSAIKRWTTRDNILTGYTWTGKNYSRQVRHTILRLFGDVPEAAEGLLREWRTLMAQRARRSLQQRKLKAQINELKLRAAEYEKRYLNMEHKNFGAAAQQASGADAALIREILDNPDDFVFHSTRPKFSESIERRGLLGDSFTTRERAEQYAQGTGRVGGDTIYVFRKSDLHPYQRSSLEKSPIGEITGPPREGIPGIKPVFKYSAREGLESLLGQADEAVTYKALQSEIERLTAELNKLPIVDNRELNQFMVNMWEKYNRDFIATSKYWKDKVDPETGLVPWHELRPGSKAGDYTIYNDGRQMYLPKAVQERLEGDLFAGRSAEQFALDAFGPLRNVQGWNAPLSILDMHAAATLSRAKYLKWWSNKVLDFARELAHGALRLWKLDKVYRPRTGIVATADELWRMFHLFGPDAWIQWIDDKIRAFSEYMVALGTPHKRGTSGWLDRSRVEHRIIKRWERRRLELADSLPQQFRMQNRHFDEQYGEGFVTLEPNDPGYLAAAEHWTSQGPLGDSGFRAALRGDEAFEEWWNTHPDAEQLKRGSTMTPTRGMVPNALLKDEFLNGYLNYFDKVLLEGPRRLGRVEEAMQVWLDTVLKIEAAGGTATAATLPKWILRNLGPITGIRRGAPGGNAISKVNNKFMDMLFLEPAKYRQQFLAAQIRKYEERRLQTLLTDQRYKIVPDDVIETATRGEFAITRHSQEWGDVAEIAKEFGIVPESWIRRLAENKAVEEAEHIMYAWHKSSRLGRTAAAQAVVPFGAPWADMWGFYGREMLLPMAARGMFSNKVLDLGKYVDPVLNWLPNLRTAAMISKMAATDFSLDRGFAGEGAFSLDFSPFFFLPTEGENAFMTLLPGFGAIPMVLIDQAIRAMAPPDESPERYQFIIDQVSELIPSVGFQQQGAGRILGGGHVASFAKVTSDISAALGFGWVRPAHDWIGDITAEQDATRNIRALLADPDNWNDLINSVSGDEYEVNYRWLTGEAFKRAGGSHLADTLVRQLVPARTDFDPSGDELMNVWVDAAEKFEALHVPGMETVSSDDDQARAELADAIRTKFWNLPQEERDLLVLQQPSLVVNMVGGWDWTPKAQDEIPNEAGVPYRTEGSAEGLARHQAYIKEGYIRPISPGLMIHNIVGAYFAARERVAKRAYSLTVQDRNNWTWNNIVPQEWKDWFEFAAQAPEVREYLRDDAGGKELWEQWSSLEEVYEEGYLRAKGVDPETATDEEREEVNVKLPQEMEAWSRVWRGLDDENFSKRFNEQLLPGIIPEVQRIFEVLGVEAPVGTPLTGEQFLNIIHQQLSDDVVDHPAKVRSASEYDIYLNNRGQPSDTMEGLLNAAIINEDFDNEFRAAAQRLLRIRDINDELREEYGYIPPDRIHLLREAWDELRRRDVKGTAFDFDEVWDDLFRRDYGAQDWEPPKPPEEVTDALAVSEIRSVLDGDTLVVRLADSGNYHRVRLLGIDAHEMSTEEGRRQRDQLKQAIISTVRAGGKVQLVPDTTATGGRYTDPYGRLLAWVFLDGEPYYFPEQVRP